MWCWVSLFEPLIDGGRSTLNDRPEIGQLVHEVRKRLGLTQEKFAARLGVTFPTVNRWENGRSRPSPLALQRIGELVRAMGKDAADLLIYFKSNE